jgi:uncharacterized protein (TIGR02001 family)
MKKLFTAIILSSSMSVFATISSTVTLTSDYVWRGVSQNEHESAIQGSMDYDHKSGAKLGLWSSSIGGSANGQEVDLYAGYTHKINEQHSIGLLMTNYTYTRESNSNWSEYGVSWASPWFNFSFATTSEYEGNEDDGTSTYMNLSKSMVITENVGLILAYGMTTVGDEDKFGRTGYLDYKVAITKTKGDWTAEMFHTNTTGRQSAPTDTTIHSETDSVVGFSLTTSL